MAVADRTLAVIEAIREEAGRIGRVEERGRGRGRRGKNALVHDRLGSGG